jgi:transcriptional regulator with PAS, ATPase and Fis domain
MKYLVTMYSDDDLALTYEEWAGSRRELSSIISRIYPLMEPGDTMVVTDPETGEEQQVRRKVAA